MVRMHDDEIEIGEHLVRALLGTLSPAYDDLPLRRLEATGSTNALFRLGEGLLVRVPRQPGETETIEKEARWLPYVGPALPVSVPEIVAVGEPGFGYPERWSVVRWLAGEAPAVPRREAEPRRALARDLAAVVNALRALSVPPDAISDPGLHSYRCDPLPELDEDMVRWFGECRQVPGLDLDLDACARLWDQAVQLDRTRREPHWTHGDLLGENLLCRGTRLTAVLDFGGLAVGDPTVDLVAAWELLDPVARKTFRAAVDVDEETWLRGRAWAMTVALMALPYYWSSMPERCVARLAMLQAVLDDAAPG
jgi:aminoglycoside phosphotransferase (APT) family kinase protein